MPNWTALKPDDLLYVDPKEIKKWEEHGLKIFPDKK
jgi:hypothetical protein